MDAEFWTTKATACLDALVLAARLGGRGPAQVGDWVSGDTAEAVAILRRHDEDQAADTVAELESTNATQTAASVRLTMYQMLAGGE